jgi:hypothetical protein
MNDPVINSAQWDWDTASTAEAWKHSHNYVHHTFTNIRGKDKDLGYEIMRIDPHQKWHPVYLLQPIYNAILMLAFEYGVAFHDLDLEAVRAGDKSHKEVLKDLKGITYKLRLQITKDYVAWPLVSGLVMLGIDLALAAAGVELDAIEPKSESRRERAARRARRSRGARGRARGAVGLPTAIGGERHLRGAGEPPNDLGRRLDRVNAADALPRLPVVAGRAGAQERALELPEGSEGVERAHEVLRPPPAEESPRERPGPRAHPLDLRRAEDGDGHAGDPLGEHDVVLGRVHERLLVRRVGAAFRGRDEARAHLYASIPEPEGAHEVLGLADPARADERQAERGQLLRQLLRALRPGVAAGAVVDGDQAVDAGVEPLLPPLQLSDVVVNDCVGGARPLDHPARVAEGGDEETDPLLEGDVDPLLHPLAIATRRLLDERVHADRAVGERADVAQPGAELVPVHVRQ